MDNASQVTVGISRSFVVDPVLVKAFVRKCQIGDTKINQTLNDLFADHVGMPRRVVKTSNRRGTRAVPA